MSVGHLARLLEDSGVPTVIIASDVFRDRLQAMTLPRVILTPYPMGQPVGPPGDTGKQQEAINAALDLLQNGTEAGTIQEISSKKQISAR